MNFWEQWQHHSQEREKDMARCTDRKKRILTHWKEMMRALIPCKAFATKNQKNHVKITCCSKWSQNAVTSTCLPTKSNPVDSTQLSVPSMINRELLLWTSRRNFYGIFSMFFLFFFFFFFFLLLKFSLEVVWSHFCSVANSERMFWKRLTKAGKRPREWRRDTDTNIQQPKYR